MSTLILASSGTFIISGILDEYLPKPMDAYRIAYITTASKKVFDIRYVEDRRATMQQLCWDYEEIDIAGKHYDELKEILSERDFIFVEGGNAFYLLQTVRESGFDMLLGEMITAGIVYAGSSAGAYIMGQSIISSTRSSKGYDRCGIENLTGLEYVPFIIKAHYRPEDHVKFQESASSISYPVWAISDKQAIFVQDDEVSIIGGGEQVIL